MLYISADITTFSIVSPRNSSLSELTSSFTNLGVIEVSTDFSGSDPASNVALKCGSVGSAHEGFNILGIGGKASPSMFALSAAWIRVENLYS